MDRPRPRPVAHRPAPVSSAQARLWVLQRLRPLSTEYNLQFAFRVRGDLDSAALDAALDAVVQRHEPLRTVLAMWPDNRAVQLVLPHRPVRARRVPVGMDGPEQVAEAAAGIATAELARPFDLEREPPMRACIARFAADDHLVAVTVHHSAFDGWSAGLLARELDAGYRAARGGVAADTGPLPVSYSDYAWWEREVLDADGETLRRFWRDELAGIEDLELPADRPGTGVGGAAGAVSIAVPAAEAAALRSLGRDEGATMFSVLLAAYAVLLQRYSGQRDIVIGIPVTGRTDPLLEPLVGCFVNTVCLRIDADPTRPFRAVLRTARDALLAARAHQDLPFDDVVRLSGAERDGRRHPLFRAFASYLESDRVDLQLGGLDVVPVLPAVDRARFDLSVVFAGTADGLSVSFDYSRSVLDDSTARRIAGHLRVLLGWAAAQPDQPAGLLPVMLPPERRDVLSLLNAG